MPTDFFHVPFMDERCDDIALTDCRTKMFSKYIPRVSSDQGVHPSNESSLSTASLGGFSDIRNGDTLWIAGHGARHDNNKIVWIKDKNNRIEFTSDELAKWIGLELKKANVTQLNFILLTCFSANNWFGQAFGGKFAAALKTQNISGSVKGFKGVVDDGMSYTAVRSGGAVTKGSSRINYAAHSVLNGLIQVGSLGFAAHHEAPSGSTGNSVVYPIPN